MGEKDDDPLIGVTAPAFCLPDSKGSEVCLEQYRGKWVVLYFYPRDNTPGCTLEALSFSEATGIIRRTGSTGHRGEQGFS
jgi:peroxiredoxin Q/BCP